MPTNVLIAGGGPAALEAALALHRLAGDRVALTLLAPEADLTYRPLSVLGAVRRRRRATTYPLERMAADIGFTHVRGRLASVDPAAHTVTTVAGERMGYDALLIASGARPSEPFPAATAFAGSLTDQERLHGIVQDVEGGYLHRIAFVVPAGRHLAAAALRARADARRARLRDGDRRRAALRDARGRRRSSSSGPRRRRRSRSCSARRRSCCTRTRRPTIVDRGSLRVTPDARALERRPDRVAAAARGPERSPACPPTPQGFLATDGHARVLGVPNVYAAGDVTAFPIKQGGIACQQADAAAADIAARAGAPSRRSRSRRSCAACC